MSPGEPRTDTALVAGMPPVGRPRNTVFSKRRICAVVVLLPLLVLLGGVGYYALQQALAEHELQEVVVALDRDEPGWRLTDIEQQRTTLPAEQNSAPLILKLKGQVPKGWWKEVAEEKWRDLPAGVPLPADQAALLKAKIDPIEPLLPELRRLSDRPRGHFAIAWSKDAISTTLPHMDTLRPLADVLLADVYWQAHHGSLDQALVSCRAILTLARSVEDEPLLISQLVHMVCLNRAVHGTHHVLACGEPTTPALAALQAALAKSDQQDPFVTAMRGERAGMHELFTNLQNGSVSLGQVLSLMGLRGNAVRADRHDRGNGPGRVGPTLPRLDAQASQRRHRREPAQGQRPGRAAAGAAGGSHRGAGHGQDADAGMVQDPRSMPARPGTAALRPRRPRRRALSAAARRLAARPRGARARIPRCDSGRSLHRRRRSSTAAPPTAWSSTRWARAAP